MAFQLQYFWTGALTFDVQVTSKSQSLFLDLLLMSPISFLDCGFLVPRIERNISLKFIFLYVTICSNLSKSFRLFICHVHHPFFGSRLSTNLICISFLKKILLLFYYSCAIFTPFDFFHLAHPRLPQSIATWLSMSMGHPHVFFDESLTFFP